MHAPAWICQEIARFHAPLRLGWDGELGRFGLIVVSRPRLAERTFYEYWGGRGPIFSKTGRPAPDWDQTTMVPMYLTDVSPEDVFSGRVLRLVKRWARPIAARSHSDAISMRNDIENKIDDVSREMASRIYREGQRDGAGAPIVAKKFITPTVNQEKYRNGKLDIASKVMPPAPPGGWQKHLDADQGDADNLGEVKSCYSKN